MMHPCIATGVKEQRCDFSSCQTTQNLTAKRIRSQKQRCDFNSRQTIRNLTAKQIGQSTCNTAQKRGAMHYLF